MNVVLGILCFLATILIWALFFSLLRDIIDGLFYNTGEKFEAILGIILLAFTAVGLCSIGTNLILRDSAKVEEGISELKVTTRALPQIDTTVNIKNGVKDTLYIYKFYEEKR